MKVREIIADRSQWLTHPDYDSVKPLVSIILPTYSRAKSGLLKKCLNSVLKQSFRRLELIIVDDASVDGTFDICKKYMQDDPRVSIIRHTKNMALPAISTYEAYLKARGEYIAYAFDDNQWELEALAETYDFMVENGIKASYGVTKVMDPALGYVVELGRPGDGPEAMDTLWQGNQIGAGSVVLHREVLETVGLHDPHLSLTRVCDWDLWMRMIERYDFVATGISFALEMGIAQPDSLGNAFKLDQWFFREWQQRRDLHTLLPKNYAFSEVTAYSERNSPYYLECLKEHYQQYRSRVWFSQEEWNGIAHTDGDLDVKRVLMLSTDLTASFMQIMHCSEDCYVFAFHYAPNNVNPPIFFSMADIVIFGRFFFDFTILPQIIHKLEVPCYYFVDDNFRELAVDSSDSDVRHLAKLTNAKNLASFDGVIVTNEPLRQYFLKQGLHQNVILLGALYHAVSAPRRAPDKALTVGFMGGAFRQDTLKNCVLPALQKLAKERPVRLVLPYAKGEKVRVEKLGGDSIEIIPFRRTSNYEYVLNFYRAQGVDILVHCGRNIRNNLYKTKSALLNASALGAALLVSDIEPYCFRDDGEPEGDYLLIRNTPEDWEAGLRLLANDPARRAAMVQTAQSYCETQYSSEKVWAEANAAFLKIPTSNLFLCLKRYDELVCWLMRNGGGGGALLPAHFRQYDPAKLSFTEELKLPRRFGFTAGVDCVRELGLLFAIEGDCVGEVVLRITNRRGELLAEQTLQMEALARNAYTNIFLPERLFVRPKELLYLEFSMKYEVKDGYVGLFEDRTRRNFFYKAFNRIGHPIPGKNVLFVDCRS